MLIYDYTVGTTAYTDEYWFQAIVEILSKSKAGMF